MLTPFPATSDRGRPANRGKTMEVDKNNMTHAVSKTPLQMADTQEIFPATLSESAIGFFDQLMPFGAAARAIFVNANGLSAYNDAIRCGYLFDFEQFKRLPEPGA
jgi:hypothetical protein